jgi:hypothetical protein
MSGPPVRWPARPPVLTTAEWDAFTGGMAGRSSVAPHDRT